MALTKLERRILVALMDAGNEMSTVELNRALETRPGKFFSGPSFASIYEAGESLEKSGMIQTYQAPGGAERSFRPRRIYRLTGHGLAEARAAKETSAC